MNDSRSPRRTVVRRLSVLSVALGLAAPASAAAAPGFLDPASVSDEITVSGPCFPICGGGSTPDVGMSPNGDTVAVWTEPDATPGQTRVRYSARPAGGSFSPARTVASGAAHVAPQVAMSADGDATLIFTRIVPPVPPAVTPTTTIETARRPAGSDFGAHEPIGGSTSPVPATADLAVNRAGDAIAVWQDGAAVKASMRRGDGPFGGATTIPGGPAAPPFFGTVPAAIDPAGNAIVLWSKMEAASQKLVASYRPSNGSFPATPDEVGPLAPFRTHLDVAFDDAGHAVAIWSENLASVHSASRAKGADFGSPQLLASAGQAPSLAVAGDGRAIAVWGSGSPVPTGVVKATRPTRGAAFGTATPVVGATPGPATSVVVNRSGEGLLVTGAAPSGASARPLSVDGKTGAAEALDTVGGGFPFVMTGPPVAMDDEGNGAIAAVKFTTTGPPPPSPCIPPICMVTGTERVEVVGFDNAGPQLRSLNVPASGQTGQQLGFSARAVDVWSNVASTNWSFGDGGSALGNDVQHAFASPGTYGAKVTATDSLGNATTSSARNVAVSAPPVPRAPLAPGDTELPIVGEVSMLRRTFAVGRASTPVAARRKAKKPKKGSAFRFSSSEPASVSILVQRQVKGRKSKKKCVKATKRNRRAKSCKRYVKAGELSRRAARGPNTVPFSGRIGKKALKPGSYRATLVATDEAGNKSLPARISFKIVR